jgi:hypothetical protein
MTKIAVKSPLLGLKQGDSNIYIFESHIGLVSKGVNKFYKDYANNLN